jgi:hypothetical protein
MGFFEHRIGFADTRGMAEVDLELSQAALFDESQEIFRLEPLVWRWNWFSHEGRKEEKGGMKKEKVFRSTRIHA